MNSSCFNGWSGWTGRFPEWTVQPWFRAAAGVCSRRREESHSILDTPHRAPRFSTRTLGDLSVDCENRNSVYNRETSLRGWGVSPAFPAEHIVYIIVCACELRSGIGPIGAYGIDTTTGAIRSPPRLVSVSVSRLTGRLPVASVTRTRDARAREGVAVGRTRKVPSKASDRPRGHNDRDLVKRQRDSTLRQRTVRL